MPEPQDKKERERYFKKLFYGKWGTYENYLLYKKSHPKKKSLFFLKVVQAKCPYCRRKAERIGMYKKKIKHFLGFTGLLCENCGRREKADLSKIKEIKEKQLYAGNQNLFRT